MGLQCVRLTSDRLSCRPPGVTKTLNPNLPRVQFYTPFFIESQHPPAPLLPCEAMHDTNTSHMDTASDTGLETQPFKAWAIMYSRLMEGPFRVVGGVVSESGTLSQNDLGANN